MNDGSRMVADDGLNKMATAGDLPQAAEAETQDRSARDDAPVVSPALDLAPLDLATLDLATASAPARLLASREALGLSARDVAARTRITLRHIEALETGDYAALPGRPYALGFARAYARAVGLDGVAIADAVRAELEGSANRPEPRILHQFEVGDPAKTPSRLVVWLALFLAVGFLGMGGVLWRSYYAPAVALPSLADAAEPRQADLTRPQAGHPVPATVPSAVGAVVFTALEEGIWVKFYDGNGQQLMQKQLAKGESYMVPADAASPRLWTGRPDALSITIGGQAMPRLSDTEKVMKDVPVDATALRARIQAMASKPAAAQTSGAAGPAAPQ